MCKTGGPRCIDWRKVRRTAARLATTPEIVEAMPVAWRTGTINDRVAAVHELVAPEHVEAALHDKPAVRSAVIAGAPLTEKQEVAILARGDKAEMAILQRRPIEAKPERKPDMTLPTIIEVPEPTAPLTHTELRKALANPAGRRLLGYRPDLPDDVREQLLIDDDRGMRQAAATGHRHPGDLFTHPDDDVRRVAIDRCLRLKLFTTPEVAASHPDWVQRVSAIDYLTPLTAATLLADRDSRVVAAVQAKAARDPRWAKAAGLVNVQMPLVAGALSDKGRSHLVQR